MKLPIALAVLALSSLPACRSAGVEQDERRAELEANLAEARDELARNPDSEDAWIWVGRRLGYLGRYREAVEWYTDALRRFPDSYKLRRHRGHRYITLRDFDAAVADLSRAAELCAGVPDEWEPDGAPNRYGVPRSTNQNNIYYHLGLALYLRGDYEAALPVYEQCLALSEGNDDHWVATAHWAYMTLRRLGRHADAQALLAPVHKDMGVIENFGYYHLLLMYRGWWPPSRLEQGGEGDIQDATVMYGLANWSLANGNEERALSLMRRIVEGPARAAFGYIAAEVDLGRRADG